MPTDFRRSPWGSTKSQVKAVETDQLVEEADDQLIYKGTIAAFPCHMLYHFEGDVLVRGSYHIDHHDDGMDGVAYRRLYELLESKYGPAPENREWKGIRRVDIRTVGELGEAVAAGLLNVSTCWSAEDTNIVLKLGDDDDSYNAYVVLGYYHASHFRATRRPADVELL
jgi:hypothetical protein